MVSQAASCLHPKIISTCFLPMVQELKSKARSQEVPRYRETESKQWLVSLDATWETCLAVSNPKLFSNTQGQISGLQKYLVLGSIPFSTLLCKHCPVEVEKLENWLKVVFTNDVFYHLEPYTQGCGPQTSSINITWEHLRHTASQAPLQTCCIKGCILTEFEPLGQFYAL